MGLFDGGPEEVKPIYLDHAATTPLDAQARVAMEPYLGPEFGNPSSVHRLGQQARMVLEAAREFMASALGADRTEIVFTSGGTESDNAAIRGVARSLKAGGCHLVTSAIEHEAVLEPCEGLRRQGFEISLVPPDGEGLISAAGIEAAIRPDTVAVSVMYANNEIGTVQPIGAIGAACRRRGVLFHVDAVQALGTIPIDVKRENIDLLSLSAHKFYGPKGVGALYVRRGIRWQPQQLGGGQERRRRSGTENVAGIVGMVAALERALDLMPSTSERIREMRDFLFEEITSKVQGAVINGSRMNRLPGNVNVSFPGLSGESLIIALDRQGIMASSGSACSSGSLEPSHVLAAIGASSDRAVGSVRLTLGRENTWEEIRHVAATLLSTVERLHAAAGGRASVPVAF